MKPQEYFDKYNFKRTIRFNHGAFVKDLKKDFTSLVDLHKAQGWNETKFKNCIREIRLKFDNIFSPSGITDEVKEKLWGYFYASVVGPESDRLSGEQGEGGLGPSATA